MDTEDFAQRLAASSRPVRPLGAPARRAAFWILLSLPVLALTVLIFDQTPSLGRMAEDTRFLVEQLAAATTAVTAAWAAFASTIPGAGRRWLWLPLLPLAVWLGSLGAGCLSDYVAMGSAGLALRLDTDCLVPMLTVGIIPTILLVLMLRRGAPLQPRLTLALGGLAVGALANVALQLFHEADISIMVLTWHLGAVAVLTAASAAVAPRILRWRAAGPAI